jgi:hypothetical protein
MRETHGERRTTHTERRDANRDAHRDTLRTRTERDIRNEMASGYIA